MFQGVARWKLFTSGLAVHWQAEFPVHLKLCSTTRPLGQTPTEPRYCPSRGANASMIVRAVIRPGETQPAAKATSPATVTMIATITANSATAIGLSRSGPTSFRKRRTKRIIGEPPWEPPWNQLWFKCAKRRCQAGRDGPAFECARRQGRILDHKYGGAVSLVKVEEEANGRIRKYESAKPS